jgi:predicted ABC-type transport system involved in lysophospholipase L1 biosynthesis ATPase subunit
MLHNLKKTILDCKEPLIIDINIDLQEYRGPSVKTIVSSNGKIKSTLLNNINW